MGESLHVVVVGEILWLSAKFQQSRTLAIDQDCSNVDHQSTIAVAEQKPTVTVFTPRFSV